MRRMAILSNSSNKKSKNYSLRRDASPLIERVDRLSDEKSMEIEKINKIFKSKDKKVRKSPYGKMEIIQLEN